MSRLIVWRPPLNLAMLAAYRKVRFAADREREYHDRVVNQADLIVGKISEQHCEPLLDRIEDLRRQLRLITKGTPLTESLNEDDKEPLLTTTPGFNQRQYDAHTMLLKSLYRKLAMLCHPDRGHDGTVFKEVETAYKQRDLYRMNTIYQTIVNGRNLYWQQSEGVYHLSSEYERYRVHIVMLKQTDSWKAVTAYLSGQVNKAAEIVHQYLMGKIAALINEINYVQIKGNEHHGEEGKRNQELQGPGQEGEQGREGGQEVQRCESQVEGQGREDEEGHDATGESATGTCGW